MTEVKKILIVEDDPDNQELLQEIITSCSDDFYYSSVKDGEEALQISEVLDFDLVFMDMGVPKKDGYELTKTLREKEHYQSVPIVALTAHAMNEAKIKALESGCDEYLPKPCKPSDLIKIIKKHLGCKQKCALSF